MESNHRFFVDPLKFFAGSATLLFFTLIAIILLFLMEYVGAVIFFILGLLFVPSILQYGTIVSLDEDGIESHFLKCKPKRYKWDEIVQVGIVGSRIFRNNGGKKPGTLFLYFSRERLSDDALFEMMLHFPPKDKIVLVCIEKTYNSVRLYWHGPINAYNVENTEYT